MNINNDEIVINNNCISDIIEVSKSQEITINENLNSIVINSLKSQSITINDSGSVSASGGSSTSSENLFQDLKNSYPTSWSWSKRTLDDDGNLIKKEFFKDVSEITLLYTIDYIFTDYEMNSITITRNLDMKTNTITYALNGEIFS